jgi:archaellum component FlaC
MTIEALENRVVRLEVTQENHSEDIKELRSSHLDMSTKMGNIDKSLNQIKYLAMGALAVVVAQTMGIDQAIKMLIRS